MAPIDTAPLFAPLHDELVALLRSLTADEWTRPTVAGAWRVRDVAAHLLDVHLRKIAVYRDGHFAPAGEPITSPADVARFVNSLNAGGVDFARRLSPQLITDLLAMTGTWVAALVAVLPPDEPAIFAVSWAGEERSLNWMDTGREYTEHWHHQQQIRDAVGRPLLLEPRWLRPLLDISVRALPVAYDGLVAPDGASVRLTVDEDPDTTWTITRSDGRWALSAGAGAAPDAVVTLSGDTAWRLFYNALTPDQTRARVAITGARALAEPMLGARSVVL